MPFIGQPISQTLDIKRGTIITTDIRPVSLILLANNKSETTKPSMTMHMINYCKKISHKLQKEHPGVTLNIKACKIYRHL